MTIKSGASGLPSGLGRDTYNGVNTMDMRKPDRGVLNDWRIFPEPDLSFHRIRGISTNPPHEMLTTSRVLCTEDNLIETRNSRYTLGTPAVNSPSNTLTSMDELVQLHGTEWVEVLKALTPSERAFVMLQLMGEYTDKEHSREFKQFALELAETLGPDHCQTLYRLAVLATKLA